MLLYILVLVFTAIWFFRRASKLNLMASSETDSNLRMALQRSVTWHRVGGWISASIAAAAIGFLVLVFTGMLSR